MRATSGAFLVCLSLSSEMQQQNSTDASWRDRRESLDSEPNSAEQLRPPNSTPHNDQGTDQHPRGQRDDRKHWGRLAVSITPVLSPSAALPPHSIVRPSSRMLGTKRKRSVPDRY